MSTSQPDRTLQPGDVAPNVVLDAITREGKVAVDDYRGRKAVFELMTMSSAIREMTFKGEPTQNIRRQAQMMGMKTIVQDALEKALKGITSIQEVLMLHRGGH